MRLNYKRKDFLYCKLCKVQLFKTTRLLCSSPFTLELLQYIFCVYVLIYFSTFQGPELVLTDIGRLHSGDYICRADNGVGRGAVRETVKLDVLRE